jgi:DHA2 family methylenomycin A resistance protein-like MFS transporter
VGFAFAAGFYGLVFLFSLYLQELRDLSPLATGLSFVPMTATGAFVTLNAPRLGARLGPRVPLALGQMLMALGLASLVVAVNFQAPVLLLVSLTIPVGAGSALTIPTITAMLLGSVPVERAGTASGVLNTSRQLGGAIAVAVFGALVAQRETFVPGMQLSLAIGAGFLLATAITSLQLTAKEAHA